MAHNWFYRLGNSAGPAWRKGQWFFQSMTGTQEERIRAEEAMGKDLAAALLNQIRPAPDAQMQRFLQEIGQRVARAASNQLRSFHFQVLADAQVNAFALPGGYIFVSRGLLELTGMDPDQIGFVLGHEMAHVIKQHSLQRWATDASLSAIFKSVRIGGVAGGMLSNAALKLLGSAHTQEHEFLADKLGLRLSQVAGFDQRSGLRLLKDLAGLGPESPLGQYFSSHPPLARRIQALEEYILALGKSVR